ncbi:VRR-NUC domain-containing protein [Halomonas sp. KAO]|uniref:VRR-NUC domain-containing protein n=1 Tax=unclassified Halomonas TaxID=2609666 RepID=UPI0018A07127|nr:MULTISPECIES: VRR-NUC domain-containing protein [unclassified Halomonas]MBF7054910.1 VRR-NUC domain-containing protein [Halomonas sp. KAO]MDT0501493.1 VRR-NUC domain-containing protein [Halomonas sp. PAR7]MDT0512825.1 VRR-NUC domain-containing protein [Halomonas sp. LES1]MDT0591350.1 VRR-NUC domain-containing protein [Halomonas sp. PAR8]
MNSNQGIAAPLEDPLYYLANFEHVLAWVAERHGDLLGDDEHAFLALFAGLPLGSRALLVRMVMRKGEHFRPSRLAYPEIDAEIGDTESALAPLVAAGLVEEAPVLDVATLFTQLRLTELRQALAAEIAEAGLPATVGKGALREALLAREPVPRPLSAWWPEAPERVVRVRIMATCDRLRLMFFGNLRQDWSEFVLAELGHQRFERVAFGVDSRAFHRRDQVDAYLALHDLRRRLEEGESPADLAEALPARPGNSWLASRDARLCLALGRRAERDGMAELASTLYRRAGWPAPEASGEGRIRYLRLAERQGRWRQALILAEPLARVTRDDVEAQALGRLLTRLRRRLSLVPETPAPEPAPERFTLRLPGPGRVEQTVREHLHREAAPVHYVENTLLTGLFGLLCWEALFTPLPGAFFHPFQAGPADLYRDDFVTRRRDHFEACLARLDNGRYRRTILATWRDKQGLANSFVHWEALDEALLTQALACIPPVHLRICFDHLLSNLRANRAGLPDLIQLFLEASPGEPRYRLIEVKGPGDRLQDNQRRWMTLFHRHEIPAAVCHLEWVRER